MHGHFDETGPSTIEDDLCSLASESDFSVVAESEFSVVSESAAAWDVRSVASTSGGRSVRSVTSTAPADFADTATAFTVGLPVPLSAIRASTLRDSRHGTTEDDAISLASVNTRRGWPRLSDAGPSLHEPTRPASYRDILLIPAAAVASSLESDVSQRTEAPAKVRPHLIANGRRQLEPSPRAEIVQGRILLPSAHRRFRRQVHRRLDTLPEENSVVPGNAWPGVAAPCATFDELGEEL